MKKFMGFSKRMSYLLIVDVAVSILILVVNYFYLSGLGILNQLISVVALLTLVFPFILAKYDEFRRIKRLEELFPVFLRDFVETIRGGMSVPQALKTVSDNDYGELSPYIKKMSAQLDWGIPIDKVLVKFVKETKSKLIGRIVSSVIESHRYGGNLAETFQALSETALEVERLRLERKLYLNSQLVTGYIVFFVFLIVMIGLERFLVPSLSDVSSLQLTGAGVAGPQEELGPAYKEMFRNLVIIQGLFAGLAVGKMSEGSMIAGFKHSLFMVFAGIGMFFLAEAI